MNTVIIVCLIYLALLVIAAIAAFCKTGKGNKLAFFKNFKKGKFALIYIAAIPLYFIANIYNNVNWYQAIFASIRSGTELIVLRYDFTNSAALMAANPLYRAAMYICFTLVTINAVIFIFALFAARLSVSVITNKALRQDSVFILLGVNEKNKLIAASIRAKGITPVFAAPTNQIDNEELYKNKWGRIEPKMLKADGRLSKLTARFSNCKVNIIINKESDDENLLLTADFSEQSLKVDMSAYDKGCGLYVYVFGENQNSSPFIRFEELTRGRVKYINRHNLIATVFADNHPITEQLTDKEIDYNTAVLKKGTAINVAIIGFGKTGKSIYRTSVSNDRFYREQGGASPTVAPINYFIYDKEDSEVNKDLNHGCFRFEKELKDLRNKKDCYFSLPELPSKTEFIKLDIGDGRFYESLRNNLKKNTVNRIIINCGNDMENLDMAEKLYEKTLEWGIDDKTKIYVKVRDEDISEKVINKYFISSGKIITYGNEKRSVYNIDKIVAEDIEKLAKARHLCYVSEQVKGTNTEIKRAATEKWYGSWTRVQRESNISACLGIRSRLNLLGLDYVAESGEGEDAADVFAERYFKDSGIVFTGKEIFGKKEVDYSDCKFYPGTARYNLAATEHERWNAYMICEGFIPASKSEWRDIPKKKLFEMRKHINLASLDGLFEYSKYISQAQSIPEKDADVFKYDFQLMDDVVWLLYTNGYKIIKRQNDTEKL